MKIRDVDKLLTAYQRHLFLCDGTEEIYCAKLFTRNMSVQDGDLIVGLTKEILREGIPKGAGQMLFIGAHGRIEQAAKESHVDALVIEEESDIYALFNELSSGISFQVRTEARLLDTLNLSGYLQDRRVSLEHLAELISKLVANPCLILKENGEVLAMADTDSGDDKTQMPKPPLIREAFQKAIGRIKEESKELPVSLKDFPETPGSVHIGAFGQEQDGRFFLLIPEKKPLIENGEMIFRILLTWADDLCRAGKLSVRSDDFASRRYLDRLLRGQIRDADAIARMNASLGFRSSGHFFLIAADSSKMPLAKGSADSIAQELSRKSKDILATVRNEYIVVLLRTEEVNEREAIGKYDIDRYLKRLEVPVGVSQGMHNLTQTENAFKQAIAAIRLGAHYNAEEDFFFYSDYMVCHVLEKCREQTDIKRFVLPQLTLLIEHDQKHKTQYAYTLYVMLLSGNKQVMASNALGIHRTTLQYRLDKIHDLIRFDINDSYWMTRLYLSYVILIMENIVDPELYYQF